MSLHTLYTNTNVDQIPSKNVVATIAKNLDFMLTSMFISLHRFIDCFYLPKTRFICGSVLRNVEITPELPSTLPISQLPDSSNVNDPLDLDEFYRSATPSCSNVNLKSVPPTAKRELPDSSKNCSTLDDTLNESDDNMQTENEAQKYKEVGFLFFQNLVKFWSNNVYQNFVFFLQKLKWQESRIKFLELKVKEKEKREMELETVKDVRSFVIIFDLVTLLN